MYELTRVISVASVEYHIQDMKNPQCASWDLLIITSILWHANITSCSLLSLDTGFSKRNKCCFHGVTCVSMESQASKYCTTNEHSGKTIYIYTVSCMQVYKDSGY